MLFSDRLDAAEQLSQALQNWKGHRPLVLAIPRGALEIGRVLADRLDGELDVVLVRKLRAPTSPEFAIGSIDESGWVYMAPHAHAAGADEHYIKEEKRFQLELIKDRRKRYTPDRPLIDAAGRIAIVVDDGLATGATMVAALHAIRTRKPARLICAVPVASRDSLELVRPLANEVVCLHAPRDFGSVGRFYQSFEQVEDEQAIRLLNESGRGTAVGGR
ncbi:phosphoribosyltransferase [Aquabacterium sp. CECT 9606]|uniref:phosphoribosyltransferase n=1 Tax=Aquabacterium sp. CECT 9606 TaxID=2845822 RepID=UPI001E3E1FD8|nr:phosphoribosyltransferase family protein [Aquabacterium sp. CECT 9606]CAH0355863.1 Putative phosphoribosyl transferase [Aquabacterium sp. CECT 9606]